jgi:hypothetical protein
MSADLRKLVYKTLEDTATPSVKQISLIEFNPGSFSAIFHVRLTAAGSAYSFSLSADSSGAYELSNIKFGGAEVIKFAISDQKVLLKTTTNNITNITVNKEILTGDVKVASILVDSSIPSDWITIDKNAQSQFDSVRIDGNLSVDGLLSVDDDELTIGNTTIKSTASSNIDLELPGSSGKVLTKENVNAGANIVLDKSSTDGITISTNTNLSNSTTGTTVIISSSTGTNTTLPGATSTKAGVMTAADKVILDGATNLNTVGQIVKRDSSGNFSAGTITASLSGNASSATKLATARTIGGVSFDGTENIHLPGVNTPGNQNTTGNAATATKLQNVRTLTIGDSGKQFDGSGDVSWSLSDIGLGNVDNTSDIDKPISTETQSALDLKVDKVTGKGLSTNDYTTTEKNKLSGIAPGAQVNTVTSVAGKTGAVTLTKSDVGLGNVTNESKETMFTNPTFTGTPIAPTATIGNNSTQIATTAFVKNQGYALDNSVVKLTGNQTIGGDKTFTDDVRIIGDLNVSGTTTFTDVGMINTSNGVVFEDVDYETTLKTTTLSADRNILLPDADGTISLEGHTHGSFNNSTALTGANVYSLVTTSNGIVTGLTTRTLTAANIGLGNVDNTSDLNKPISTATQSALDLKQATLVSGDNIKTIVGTDILGGGDITLADLGASTVGQNIFSLTNPNAVRFLMMNADNSVSALSASAFRTAIGAGTSSTVGTVTSVGMSVPTGLSISGGPITSSGTLTLSFASGYSIPTTTKQTNWDAAYNHSQADHAPVDAQKNSDITKAEIEAKLTGAITSHTHAYQPIDADLTSIAGLTGTSGLLRKSSTNTWTLDTVNYVPTSRSINGKALSSNISLTASDVGLGNVDNTSDMNKPISTATQNALNDKQNTLSGTGFVKVSGTTVSYDNSTYALDNSVVKLTGTQTVAGNKTFSNNINIGGNLTVTGTTTVNNVEMINTSNGVVFEGATADEYETTLKAIDPTADREILLPDNSGTISLEGHTHGSFNNSTTLTGANVYSSVTTSNGIVTGLTTRTLTAANIGLGNVDNTSDMNKPVSTATQNALDLKVDKVSGKGLSTNDYTNAEKDKLSGIAPGAQVNTVTSVAGKTGDITLADLGLEKVTNESKETMFTSPTFTGTPTAPTAATGNNSTQIATTAFVKAQGYALDNSVVKLTGNQTIGGTKTFNSTISGSISGNAGTVTNGVYTTGNQTIGGEKTFTAPVTQQYGTHSWKSEVNSSGDFVFTYAAVQ